MKKVTTLCIMLALVASAAFAGNKNTVSIANKEDAAARLSVEKPEYQAMMAEKAAASAEADRLGETPRWQGSLDDCAVPFPEDVESAVVPALPACWVQISVDAASPARTWASATGTAHGGTKKFFISWSAPALDDWLISPGVALVGGTSYRLKYWRRSSSSSYTERLEIWTSSTTQDVAGMTTNILPAFNFSNTAYVQDVVDFTPGVSGTYYIGWRATSGDALGISLDDFELGLTPVDPARCCYLLGGQSVCADLTLAECTQLGGEWTDGLHCATDPCTIGRCCYGDPCQPQCLDGITDFDCQTLGGAWLEGATCTSSPCPTPQPGDLCCTALPVPGLPFTESGNTCGFTNDYDAVCPYTGGTAPDVAYSYTPTVDQLVTLSLCLSGYDTKLYVYDGAPTPGGQIACNDDANPCPGSTGSFRSLIECLQLYAGHTYCIIVDGYGSSCGDYTLVMEECVPCEVTCPPGATLEGEVGCGDEYVDNFNGGCNSDPAVFSTLDCDAVICGTAWTYTFTGLNYRDTDWYLFTVTEDLDSNKICVTTEFSGLLYIFPAAPCSLINSGAVSPIAAVNTVACEEACIDLCYEPGDYIAIVLPSVFTGIPCESAYVLSRECRPCAEPFVCHCTEGENTHCEFAIDETTYPLDSAIPTTCVTINVPFEYHITDLNVCIDLVHTFDGDLDIFLTSPGGTVIELSTDNGGGGDNYTCTTFDDEAVNSVIGGVAPFSGSYMPETPLSAVDGENALGAWVLCITDDAGGDVGWLNWVCLTFEYDEILPVAFGSFDAVAGNGSVTLNWNTESESNVDRFELSRDGSVVANVTAQNNATGAAYSYVDNNVANGTVYSYSLVSVDVNGARQALATLSATPNAGAAVITEYALHQNYPNPFNPTTNLAFDMVDAGHVSISVFNIMGQKVAELVNGNVEAGRHIVSFDATGLSSGLYLYKMEANGFTAQNKMVLMK